jgi:hypothetical protein
MSCRWLAVLGSNRQRNVEQRFAVKLSGLQALSHHLGVFALEVSFVFWVDFLGLSGDNDGLFFGLGITRRASVVFSILDSR